MCFGTGHTTDKKKLYKAYGNSFFLPISKPLYPNHKLVISVMDVLFFRHSRRYIANLSDYMFYMNVLQSQNIVKKRIIMGRYG